MNPDTKDTKSPLVSIIVPVYQVEDYIAQCAESIFQQDWPNIEAIFVDNATQDRSIEIIQELLHNKYPQCKDFTKIIRQEKRGLGFAREAGIRIARGEYIIHVDSDDWIEPDYISAMVNKAMADNADFVYCDYYREYANGEPTEHCKARDYSGKNGGDLIYAFHNTRLQSYMWNKLIHRSCYDIDTLVVPIRNMHEDMVFMTQLTYKVKNVAHIAKPLYHYRAKRAGAITVMSWADKRKNSAEGLFYLYNSLPKTNCPLDHCAQDLLMRAAWYALSTFNFKTLTQYPDIVRFIKDMKIVKGHRVPLIKQRTMKYYCKVYCLFKG